ncbi:uncharacterized protein LOC135217882 [Macrobrachium nipponense]|uniref:uncharacterized protein LOC135217882 n=1 Tax=Macrobrachium nipponense TaxID=159736 RepID=UPI0030C85B2F
MRLGLQLFGVYFFATSIQADSRRDAIDGSYGLRIKDSTAGEHSFSEGAVYVEGTSSLAPVHHEDAVGGNEHDTAIHEVEVVGSDVHEHGSTIIGGSVGVNFDTTDHDYRSNIQHLQRKNVYSAAVGSVLEDGHTASVHALRESHGSSPTSYSNEEIISSDLVTHDTLFDDAGHKHSVVVIGHGNTGDSRYGGSGDISHRSFGDTVHKNSDDTDISEVVSDGESKSDHDDSDDDSSPIPVYNGGLKFESHDLEDSDERSREEESLEYESPDDPIHESFTGFHESIPGHSSPETEHAGLVGQDQNGKGSQPSKDESHNFEISHIQSNTAAHGVDTSLPNTHLGSVSTEHGDLNGEKHIVFSSEENDAPKIGVQGSFAQSHTATNDINVGDLIPTGVGYKTYDSSSGQNTLIFGNQVSNGLSHGGATDIERDRLAVTGYNDANTLSHGGSLLLGHRFAPVIRHHGLNGNEHGKTDDSEEEKSFDSVDNGATISSHGGPAGIATSDSRSISAQHHNALLINHGRPAKLHVDNPVTLVHGSSPAVGHYNTVSTTQGQTINFLSDVPLPVGNLGSGVRLGGISPVPFGVPLSTKQTLLRGVGQRASVVIGPGRTTSVGHGVASDHYHGIVVPSIHGASEGIPHKNIALENHGRLVGTVQGTSSTSGQDIRAGFPKGPEHHKDSNPGTISSAGQGRSSVDVSSGSIGNAFRNREQVHKNLAVLQPRDFIGLQHATSSPKIVARASVSFNLGAPRSRHSPSSGTLSKKTKGIFGKEFGGFQVGQGEIHAGLADVSHRSLRRKRNSASPKQESRTSNSHVLDGLIM